ncbi:CBS domain-containing protein [Streptomyces radiopugnans]|uniref:CBS domain-containing protein n=1 Tax=Streptomyces radiopugnans TaxID=403935 RepID=A0A1H9F4B1_9ACTN|nr:CBS domain-containing protein [Streptomyces radiopugnans]SEQ32834.1 CBS domain-containing protein [Streptomyces radiopugnans]
MRQWHVRDLMTGDVVSVREDTRYREILRALDRNRVSALPAVDAQDRVVGVVSEADLLRTERDCEERPRALPRLPRPPRPPDRTGTARELMTAPAVTIGPEEPVARAARLIEDKGVKRLPVVDGERRLLGIVSRRDLVRMHVRADADIREDITDGVLKRTLWVGPSQVDVDVGDGVVELRGRVDRRTTAAFAVRLAEQVPGVVGVADRLAWEEEGTAPPDVIVHPSQTVGSKGFGGRGRRARDRSPDRCGVHHPYTAGPRRGVAGRRTDGVPDRISRLAHSLAATGLPGHAGNRHRR